MPFFSREDFAGLATLNPDTLSGSVVYQQMVQLQDGILLQLRTANMMLHPAKGIHLMSAAAVGIQPSVSILYHRQETEARTVERLMGREEAAAMGTIDSRRHPVIEIRLTTGYLALELIVSPDAWWDQQNLVGKLTIPRHLRDLHRLMQQVDDRYRLGFWQGIHLSEMHLTGDQFRRFEILSEWLKTFEAGKDWFRLGLWYKAGSILLDEVNIFSELTKEIKTLYAIYEYFLWTSDNNYRDFYKASAT